MSMIDLTKLQCEKCIHKEHENPLLRCMKYGGMFPPIWSEGPIVRKCIEYRER